MRAATFLKQQVDVFKDFSAGLLEQLVGGSQRPQLGSRGAYAKQAIRHALIEHCHYINERGEDHPFVLGWKWGTKGPVARRSSTEGDNV